MNRREHKDVLAHIAKQVASITTNLNTLVLQADIEYIEHNESASNALLVQALKHSKAVTDTLQETLMTLGIEHKQST